MISFRSMIFNCVFYLRRLGYFLIFGSTLNILLVSCCCVTNHLKFSSLQQYPPMISQFQWVSDPDGLHWLLWSGLYKAKTNCWQCCAPYWRLWWRIHFQAHLEFSFFSQITCSALHLQASKSTSNLSPALNLSDFNFHVHLTFFS